jgi:hypothetical protein
LGFYTFNINLKASLNTRTIKPQSMLFFLLFIGINKCVEWPLVNFSAKFLFIFMYQFKLTLLCLFLTKNRGLFRPVSVKKLKWNKFVSMIFYFLQKTSLKLRFQKKYNRLSSSNFTFPYSNQLWIRLKNLLGSKYLSMIINILKFGLKL